MPSLATLHLKLDRPTGHIYRPGDLVSGSVWLRSLVEEEVNDVSVVFKGHTAVRFSGGASSGPRKCQEEYNLFIRRQVLVQGPQRFPKSQVHEWLFEFVFPELSELDFEGAEVGEGADRFDLSPHKLPPSLPFDPSSCGGIAYEIEAMLQESTGDKKPRSRVASLAFMPRDDDFFEVGSVEHREVTHVYYKMRPRSIAKKIQGVFVWIESNRPLISTFTVHVDVPHDIYLGQLIPISVRLHHKPEESTLPVCPSFCIRTAEIYLITKSAARLLNLEKCPKGHRFHEAKKSRVLDMGYNMKVKLTPDKALDLRQFLGARVCDGILPFSSYSIARSYALRILLIIRCNGERKDFVVDTEIPISLLPRAVDGSQRHGSMPTIDDVSRRPPIIALSSQPTQPSQFVVDIQEEPPCYSAR